LSFLKQGGMCIIRLFKHLFTIELFSGKSLYRFISLLASLPVGEGFVFPQIKPIVKPMLTYNLKSKLKFNCLIFLHSEMKETVVQSSNTFAEHLFSRSLM